MSAPSPAGHAVAPVLQIVNADKEMTAAKCHSVYFNALSALKRCSSGPADPLSAQIFLRELYQSQRCDSVATAVPHTLAATRADVVRQLSLARAKRLIEPSGG